MKTLFVGGDYDDLNGRSSKIAEKIFQSLNFSDVDYHNGGHYNDLLKFSDRISRYGAVFWLAKIPEDKPSVSAILKSKHNSFVLVSSKRNLDEKLTTFDMICDALKIKSNLTLEFKKNQDRYVSRILDPLGNVFLDFTSDFDIVGKVLGKRVNELTTYTRMKSESVGERLDVSVNDEFLELIKHDANCFSNLLYSNPEAVTRHMGNASFRCANGFPSFKKEGFIYVSRRNVDKRGIDKDSFVAVDVNSKELNYFGGKKPSVDTPIQIKLYQNYKNINFMLHSHNYILDAPYTSRIIPCGALEEADDILEVFPDLNLKKLAVNLKGHGSVVASHDLEFMKSVKYFARPIPEVHTAYAGGLK
jgi:hypothetical protein